MTQHKRHHIEKESRAHVAHTTPSGLVESLKEKPGFAIAVIFALLVILGVGYYILFAPASDTDLQALNKSNVKDMYTQNGLVLKESVAQVATMFDSNDALPLDKFFEASIQSDLTWLTQKNDAVYATRPTELLIAREIAFTTFLQRVYFINQDFTYESTTQPNYQNMIAYAASKETPRIVDANDLANFYSSIDANETLSLFYDDPSLISAFFEETNALITDYVAWKKDLISRATTLEEKYVESKKLLYFISTD